MKNRKSRASLVIVLLWGLVASTSSLAWYEGAFTLGYGAPNVHSHNDARVYNHGGYGYYDRGGYLYSRPRNIIIPNVVINVPVERVYRPICEEVEVCDNYTGECWLDRLCN